jgi:hypothetical protein
MRHCSVCTSFSRKALLANKIPFSRIECVGYVTSASTTKLILGRLVNKGMFSQVKYIRFVIPMNISY